jgi:hypothetical protein
MKWDKIYRGGDADHPADFYTKTLETSWMDITVTLTVTKGGKHISLNQGYNDIEFEREEGMALAEILTWAAGYPVLTLDGWEVQK